ncbi:hypothetical protein [Gordonibacter sp.]|nr:hypothetical protein [Gordonibacter sp.]HIW75903.1 hypothetical protein [Candidatus Gordonibacter avicola]
MFTINEALANAMATRLEALDGVTVGYGIHDLCGCNGRSDGSYRCNSN